MRLQELGQLNGIWRPKTYLVDLASRGELIEVDLSDPRWPVTVTRVLPRASLLDMLRCMDQLERVSELSQVRTAQVQTHPAMPNSGP